MVIRMVDNTNIYFKTTITNNYSSWSKIKKISATGDYKIYLHAAKISENLTQQYSEIKKPSIDSSDDGPSTIIPKLNMIYDAITVQGKLKTQNASIAGSSTSIDATTAKWYLQDMFLVTEKTYLYWSGFADGYKQVVPKSLQFDSVSDTSQPNDKPKEVNFTAVFVVGVLI